MPVEALKQRIADFGSGPFQITADAEGHTHVVSVTPRFDDDVLLVAVGRTSRANVAANPLGHTVVAAVNGWCVQPDRRRTRVRGLEGRTVRWR